MLRKISAYTFIILSCLIMFLPFVTTIFNSLKSYAQYSALPSKWLPDPIEWSNYRKVFELGDFGQYAWNSIIVAVLSIVGALLSSSMIAYAFARLNFPFRNSLFFLVLGTMMIPPVVTIIPTFILYKHVGMLDTLTPLWLVEWLGQPFGIFLLRQAFLSIPKAYEDAAKLDGCNPFQMYWRLFLPMCKPSLATLAIFTFMTKWNEILSPSIYLSSKENYTLPIGILSLGGQWTGNEQFLVAAALLSLIPILVVFWFAEKYFVHGANSSGVK
ncbi:carbohydrate ABC transporter permease [Fictibacillus sp. NRS-1165]|uniref:carbohydrate ABC transporter permease n=1 Tax=Fictibacillus sp. NRS-1165 TaxID=3144463 RepID=UPI003D25DDCB